MATATAQVPTVGPAARVPAQKQGDNGAQRDVAGAPDSNPKAYAREDEFSAFTQFGRAQGHLADQSAVEDKGPTQLTPLPEAPTVQEPEPAGAAGGGAAPKKRRWLRYVVCCGAPPKDPPAESGSSQLPRRRTMNRSLTGGPPPSMAIRPRRTMSRQVSMYGGARRALSVVRSTYSDAQWFDSLSKFDSQTEDARAMHDEVDAMLRDMPAIDELPTVQEPGPHVPDPPLEFASSEFIYVPVPKETGFAGYWLKDEERTTPNPQPIDVMLNSSKMAQKAHESIPGIWLQETPDTFSMTAKPRSIPLGPLSRYVESFKKDGSTTGWSMRRDIKVGRSEGQIFFTACGTLIFRVYAKGMFGGTAEFVCEEYSRLEDEGNTIISRQCCKHLASGKTAVQYLVGDWAGEAPPPGHA